MRRPKALITTADDLGLADDINRGIAEAHEHGILRSAALLMNAPATDAALALRRRLPDLEVGIHLSLVEGLSLRARPGTTTDPESYMDGRLCLHRAWPQFVKRYARGGIDLGELEEELDLQLARFRDALGDIPFANGTQHLHLLPRVLEMVLRLLKKHDVPSLRLPRRSLRTPGFGRRRLVNGALEALGRRAAPRAAAAGLRFTEHFAGFDVCGQLDPAALIRLLGAIPAGTTELMSHPGYDCVALRTALPASYGTFAWASELRALRDPGVRAAVTANHIDLIQFRDLASSTRDLAHEAT